MAEYIEKESVIDALDALCDRVCVYSKKQRAVMCSACALGGAFDVVEELPAIDVALTIISADCEDKLHNKL